MFYREKDILSMPALGTCCHSIAAQSFHLYLFDNVISIASCLFFYTGFTQRERSRLEREAVLARESESTQMSVQVKS